MSIRRSLGKTLLKSKFRNSLKKLSIKFFSIFMVVNILFPASLLVYIPEKVKAQTPLTQIDATVYIYDTTSLSDLIPESSTYSSQSQLDTLKNNTLELFTATNTHLQELGLNFRVNVTLNEIDTTKYDSLPGACHNAFLRLRDGSTDVTLPGSVNTTDSAIYPNPNGKDFSLCIGGDYSIGWLVQKLRSAQMDDTSLGDLVYMHISASFEQYARDGIDELDLPNFADYKTGDTNKDRHIEYAFLHELTHLFSTHELYTYNNVVTLAGMPSVPSIYNLTSVNTPDLLDNNWWKNQSTVSVPSINDYSKDFINSQALIVHSGSGAGTFQGSSGSSSLSALERREEIFGDRIGKKIIIDLTSDFSANGAVSCQVFTSVNTLGQTVFSNPPVQVSAGIGELADDKVLLTSVDGGQNYVPGIDKSQISYLNCSNGTESKNFWISDLTSYKAYADYYSASNNLYSFNNVLDSLEGNPDKYQLAHSTTIVPILTCHDTDDWCEYNESTNEINDNSVMGIDLKEYANAESYGRVVYQTINDENLADNLTFVAFKSDGTYKIFKQKTSKEQFAKAVYDYVRDFNNYQSNSNVNYESIKKLVNRQQDVSGNVLGAMTGSTTLYLITDKHPTTTQESSLISDLSSKDFSMSTLYLGDDSIPSSYSTIATSSSGKVINKGSQQEVSERLRDLISLDSKNYYTDFTYTVTSGTEGKAPLTLQFTGESYNGYSPTSWNWDFNDDGVTDATGKTVSHTFYDKGTFDIQLNTTDGTKSDKKINYDMVDTLSSTLEPFTQWGKEVNTTSFDHFGDLDTDSAGNLYAIASAEGDVNFGNNISFEGDNDYQYERGFVIKYSSTGTAQWAKKISSDDNFHLSHIRVDELGNTYVIANVRPFNSDVPSLYIDGNSYPRAITPHTNAIFKNTTYLIKLNSNGVTQWVHQLKSDRDVYVSDFQIDKDGNPIIIGEFHNYITVNNGGLTLGSIPNSSPVGYSRPIFVIKMNNDGTYSWGASKGGSNHGNGSIDATSIDDDGNVFVYAKIYDRALDNILITSRYHSSLLKFGSSNGTITTISSSEIDNHGEEDVFLKITNMDIDAEKNIFVTGTYYGSPDIVGTALPSSTYPTQSDEFLVKVKSDYSRDWAYTDHMDDGGFEKLEVTDSGEAIVIISINSDNTTNTSVTLGSETFTSKGATAEVLASFDTDGNYEWGKLLSPRVNIGGTSFGFINYNYSSDIEIDNKNNIFLSGMYTHILDNSDGANFTMINEHSDSIYSDGAGFIYKLGTGNHFAADLEGWKSSDPIKGPISHGSAKITNTGSGHNIFLKAPKEYLGDHEDLYGSVLAFDMTQSVSTNQKTTINDIIITGYGDKISYNLSSNPSTSGSHYEVIMTESSGWVNYFTGQAVSQDTFKKILSRIQALEFRANFSNDANVVSLHSVNAGVRNNPLKAIMTSNVVSGNYPLLVNFSDISTSSGLTTTRSWDFNGDGVVDSTVANPQYTYTSTGTFTAMLTITDGADTSTTTRTIEVLDDPVLNANFSSNVVSGTEPLEVQFTDTSTAENTAITSWAWDFDNDGITDSTQQNPTHTYQDDGTYSVKLSISDGSISDIVTKTNFVVVNPANICTQNHTVTSDALVRAGTYANNNYGTLNTLTVKDGGTNFDRQSFMKFDLSSTDYTQVSSAKLRFYVSWIEIVSSTQPVIKFYDIGTNTWTETGITWNNKPTFGSEVATWNVVNSQDGTWLEIDLTTYINAKLAGDKIVNLGLWDTNAANEGVDIQSKESKNVPFLEITGVSNNCPPVLLEGTYELDRQISSSYDDAGQDVTDGNSMMRTLAYHALTKAWGSDTFVTGYRFNNISIPQGATIKQAYLEFTSYNTDGTTTSLTIIGDDTDNSSAFTGSTGNITSRANTSASKIWDNMGVWTLDSTYKSPDLKTIVQEIVDRGGWTSGNNMTFVISGTGERDIYSYDGSTAKAPKLHIEWD